MRNTREENKFYLFNNDEIGNMKKKKSFSDFTVSLENCENHCKTL
jgi:hypothetical protein